jgi:rRNA-processing protein FCF1
MKPARLLVDANLLVLYIVGRVAPRRIREFKRTSQYDENSYLVLDRFITQFKELYTLPHVLSEVSNLTDLRGTERAAAREELKKLIVLHKEPNSPSAAATNHRVYDRLGLTDAAIATMARQHHCAVLTDDLELHLALQREGVHSWKFAHLLAQEWVEDWTLQ